MRKLNNINNLTNNNNPVSKLINNLTQLQTQNDGNQLNIESKQINKITKNNLIPSKKRSISIEKDDIYSKKLGKKIESVRSKSNLVENPFYNEESSNAIKVRTNISAIDIKLNINSNKSFNSEIHFPKNLDREVSMEFKMVLKHYLEFNVLANKKALELNQKNMEIKKKLHEKYFEKKISVYELELIQEYSENVADSNEQFKMRKLMELGEKEKLLASKKIHNEKVLRLKEFYKNELEKQAKIVEEYITQIRDSKFLVIINYKIFIFQIEEMNRNEEIVLKENALLKESIEEEAKKQKK